MREFRVLNLSGRTRSFHTRPPFFVGPQHAAVVVSPLLHTWERCSSRMLRVYGALSGEELASLYVEEVADVREVKYRLRWLYGFPVCLQQLLYYGSRLHDLAKIERPIDVQLVMTGCDIAGARSAEIEAELLLAAQHGLALAVRFLLDTGVDVDAAGFLGYTPLIWASRNGHDEVVRLLLEADASIDNQTAEAEITALYSAANEGHTEATRVLLEAGANTELADTANNTALLRASRKGHVEVVRLLLAAGADTDRRARGTLVTALMYASFYGHAEVVRLLLAAGADKNLADRGGNTALSFAAQEGHTRVAQMLKSATAA